MPTKRKTIRAKAKQLPVIAMQVPVKIIAADIKGEAKGPPKFEVTAYTGGALEINGWDRPVVIDISGLTFSRSVIANKNHDDEQIVGHVTDKNKTDTTVELAGVFSMPSAARDQVVQSAADKFPWEASVEVTPTTVEEVDAGKKATANGQEFNGPIYITRKGTLSGFAFVQHGADPNTDVKIAAHAASNKEHDMKIKAEVKAWVESLGLETDDLTDEQVQNFTADFEGRESARTKIVAAKGGDKLEMKRLEAARRKEIREIAEDWCDQAIEMGRYDDLDAIKAKRDEAIKDESMSVKEYKQELRIATLTNTPPVPRGNCTTRGITDKVLEAAICQTGRLPEKDETGKPHFDDQTMQLAHERFKGRISLNEAVTVAAEANGYQGRIASRVDTEVHNAAFGFANGAPQIRAWGAGGFSTINLPSTFANVANKFLRQGWMSVDQTLLRIAATRPVNDFKQITTVSLTGGMQFQPIGPDGEFKHGAVGERTNQNQVHPSGIIFAITFVDYRNDDLGALTTVPKRIGRGGLLYLNHIGWTKFLDNASFFSAGNNNVNTGVADMTPAGLAATEVIFTNQTDPDGKPLGSDPKILLVPTPLRGPAQTMMTSERMLMSGTAGTPTFMGDGNIWKDRFRVESSPYLSNPAYTGYSPVAYYMLADPDDMPVIEIAALDGKVQPTVETADAAFNVLGVQMRGHEHVGVALQEAKGGVRADGGSS